MQPLDAGLAFLPMSLTILACAMQAGRLVARFGAGPVLASGLTLLAAGLALFTRVSVGGDYVSDFMLPSLLVATGIGLSIVPSTIAATASAAPGASGLASGLVNTSRQMGGALGLAILTSLAVLYTDHLTSADYSAPILALNDGYRLAFAIGAVFAGIGALVAFRFIPRALRPAGLPHPPQAQGGGSAAAAPGASAAPPGGRRLAPDAAAATEVPVPPGEDDRAEREVPQASASEPLRPERPSPMRVSRVVLTIKGAGSFTLSGSSMTVRTPADGDGASS
jgi:MFS family permease